MQKKRLQKGFTLIELLVVISVIGMMASIVTTSVNGTRTKARDAARKEAMRQIQVALELYFENNGSYPTTAGVWQSSSAGDNAAVVSAPGAYIPNLTPNYMARLPADPRGGDSALCLGWKRAFLYRSNGADYKLLSHCATESGFNHADVFTDPARDGGANACIVDGAATAGWAWTLYTPGATCI
ncbi:MAG: prepilin-type N-terminal cleavage/methylation domain-containing protein [Patescibacteria group bacterium]